MVITAPLGIPKKIENTGILDQIPGGRIDSLKGPGIRIVKVYEQESTQEFYNVDNLPLSVLM